MDQTAINDCMVVDGTGAPPFRGSVLIASGKIDAISPRPFPISNAINASGLVLAPGFIDAHSHSDFSLEIEPGAASRVMQGITTEVVGNCGHSPAPTNDRTKHLLQESMGTRAQWLSWTWGGAGEYLERMREVKTAVNVVFLVGHGTLRIAAMGFDRRPATKEELEMMKRLLAESLDEGAAGMSSGLAYAPGLYAETDEVVELARVLAGQKKVYSTHVRNEGRLFEDAVREAMQIGEESGVAVHVSHIKLIGKRNWGRAEQVLEILEGGIGKGVDVTADFYPYEAGSSALSAFLPPFVHEDGREGMLSKIRNPKWREEIARAFVTGLDNWWNPAVEIGWENLMVSRCPLKPDVVGRSIAELAGTGPAAEMALDLLLEAEGMVDIVAFQASLDDFKFIAPHPLLMVGSDGYALAPTGPTAVGLPHPRSFGAYPRVFRLLVGNGVLDLPTAIKKMTSMPAARWGLKGRGIIKEGNAADLVLFELDRFSDRADYRDPFQFPTGLKAVWVNGTSVVKEGKLTSSRPGRVLA